MRTMFMVAVLMLIAGAGWAQRRERGMAGFEFPPRSPQPGESAPDVELLNIRGERVRLSDARGKYLVFEFVHPGSDIAAAKIPVMNALRAKYADGGRIAFWTVLGTGDFGSNGRVEPSDRRAERERVDARKWSAYLREHEAKFEGTLLLSDADMAVARMVYGGYINQTYLIDPEGRVVQRWSWCDPAELESAMDRVLGLTGGERVADASTPVRPSVPLAQRAREARRRAQMLPVARELVRSGPGRFLADRDADGSGELSVAESGFAPELFRRADRDQSGSLSVEELQLAEEAASSRLR